MKGYYLKDTEIVTRGKNMRNLKRLEVRAKGIFKIKLTCKAFIHLPAVCV